MRRALPPLIAVLGLAVAFAGCSGPKGPTWTFGPTAASPAIAVVPTEVPSTSPAGALDKISIEAFDLGFTPTMVMVPVAGIYRVDFQNTGSTAHDVTFADGTKIAADAGQTATGSVTIPAAGLAFLCSIPGHADAGMKGEVMVEGAAVVASPAPATGGTTAQVADPGAPKYSLFDARAPQVLPGTVHDIDMPIVEMDITVAEGFVVHAWTFGGQVPGPTIRVHLGDTVNVHLTNQGSMSPWGTRTRSGSPAGVVGG